MQKRILIAAALLIFAFVLAFVLLRPDAPVGHEPSADQNQSPAEVARLPAGGDALARIDEVSAKDCLEGLAAPEGSSQLMAQQRRQRIESFLEEQGGPLEQQLVADLAGIDHDDDPVLNSGLPARLFWTYGAPGPTGKHELSGEEQRRLASLLDSEGVEGLIALRDASLFQARWGDTTLAGHLVREHGESLYAALPAADIPIGLHELAFAIEAGVSLAGFATLLEASGIDPATTWHNSANLAKVAAIHARADILRLLTSKGVDPTTPLRWGRQSTLDAIASRPKPHGEQFADVVQQLTAGGDRPYLPSTLATLEQWLPDLPMPALHPDAAAALLDPALADVASAVAEMDVQWAEKVDAAARLEQRCEALLADAQQSDSAFEGTDLAAKRRYQEALQKREERWLEELERTVAGLENTVNDTAADVARQRASAELGLAVTDGRWDDAIAIADQLGGYAHWVLLIMALGSDAPLDVLLTLTASNGGKLPEHAAEYLAGNRRADAAEIAEALEPFGLDVHYVDAQGRNAFHFVAKADLAKRGTWQFAEYLASRSVAPKPSAFGLDPLDTVLTSLLEYPLTSQGRIRFARFLIDQGAPVEPSHLQLAELIATENERTHQRLLSSVPELAS